MTQQNFQPIGRPISMLTLLMLRANKLFVPTLALVVSFISLATSLISSYYISNADISKFRLEKSLDYCQRVAFGTDMEHVLTSMRNNDEFNKAKDHRIDVSDTRIIGDYLNILEYAAIFVISTKLKDQEQARDIFSTCTCSLFWDAKNYYLGSVRDQTQYAKLNELVNDTQFWEKTEPCRGIWMHQP